MKRFLLSAAMLAAVNAQASEDTPGNPVSLGVAASYSTGPYRDYSQKVTPLPLILYEGSFFYIRGTETGFKILNSGSDEISISASLLPFYFKPKYGKTESLKQLNERKLSATAGLSWTHKAAWGFTVLSANQRITGSKEGAIIAAGYGYPFQFGQTTLIVSTGVEYSTAEMNRNYFGISSEESSRSGLRDYNPGGGFSPYLDFMASYPVTSSIDVSAGARFSRLSDAEFNSPMVKDRLTQAFIASISYSF